MTDRRLDSYTFIAITGAELLNDDDLADRFVELAQRAETDLDDNELGQDLRELAAVCLTWAGRLDPR